MQWNVSSYIRYSQGFRTYVRKARSKCMGDAPLFCQYRMNKTWKEMKLFSLSAQNQCDEKCEGRKVMSVLAQSYAFHEK